MNILAVLNPLYKDLLTIGFEGLMSDTNFSRVTNTLGLTDIYAGAFNEVQKAKENDPFSWLPAISETDKEILGTLDTWDQAFIDELALSFRLIIFDYPEIGL